MPEASGESSRAPAAAAAAAHCADVTAVVVTYNPDHAALRELLVQTRSQVGRTLVVDNASANDVATALPPATDIELVRNGANLGIGAAQNIGIARALESPQCAYVLLLDGDSLPAPGMVAALRAAIAGDAGPGPVAAAGPLVIDLRTGQAGAVLIDVDGRRSRRTATAVTAVQDVGFLIASGTLIPAAVLHALGGMRGNYFIDHVDTEWCFRARAAGYRLLLAPGARLNHRLGESVRRLRLLPAWPVPYHAPLRDYYAFRNTLLMLRDTPISVHWRLSQMLRLLRFVAYHLVWGDLRRQRLRHMWLGIRHGRAGISGRLVAGSAVCEPVPVTTLDPAARR